MKKITTRTPLRRCKPLELPLHDVLSDHPFLIQFSTCYSGGYAIQCDGLPGEFSIEDLV